MSTSELEAARNDIARERRTITIAAGWVDELCDAEDLADRIAGEIASMRSSADDRCEGCSASHAEHVIDLIDELRAQMTRLAAALDA